MNWHSLRLVTVVMALSTLLAAGGADSAAPDTRQVTFAGSVQDNRGQPVVGARIMIAGSRATTGRSGRFSLVTRSRGPFALVIEHRDFAYYAKELFRPSDREIFRLTRASRRIVDPRQRITLRDERRPEDCPPPPSARTGDHPCGPGFAVDIAANTLVDDRGRAAIGPVEVKLATFDIETESMPGPYAIATSTRNPTSMAVMTPYGAGMVEVRDVRTGRKLKLRPGTTAGIEIPVHPLALQRTGDIAPPPVIPLLKFDESILRWAEVGEMSLKGDFYSAKVEQFAPYNADTQESTWGCLYIEFWGVPPTLITNPPEVVLLEVRGAQWGFDADGTAHSSPVTSSFYTTETGPELNWTYQLIYNLRPNIYYWGRAYNGTTLLTADAAQTAVMLPPQTPQQPPLPKNPQGVCTHMNLTWDADLNKRSQSWKDVEVLSGPVLYATTVSMIESLENPIVTAELKPGTQLNAIGLLRNKSWILAQTRDGLVGLVPYRGADLSRTHRPAEPPPGPSQDGAVR